MTSQPPRRPKQADRRGEERLPVDAPARLVHGTIVLAGRIENIAPGGAAFITAEMTPEVAAGTRVRLVASDSGADGADHEFDALVLRTETLCDVSGESRVYALGFDPPIDLPAAGGAAAAG